MKPDYKDAKISATSNFWGTGATVDISKMVNDRNDSLSYANNIDISTPLSQPAQGTPANSILQAEEIAAEKATAQKPVKPKLVTITCAKGKLTKRVTAVKPVCPSGYKKK